MFPIEREVEKPAVVLYGFRFVENPKDWNGRIYDVILGPIVRRSLATACSRYARFAREIGSERSRLPVAVKIALRTAGNVGGTPVSPMPPILSPLAITCTSTFGASLIRSI